MSYKMNVVRGGEVLTGVLHLFPPQCSCQLARDQNLALSPRLGRSVRNELENKDSKVSALNFKSLGFGYYRSLRKSARTSTTSSPTPTRQRCPRLGEGVVDERKETRVWTDCAHDGCWGEGGLWTQAYPCISWARPGEETPISPVGLVAPEQSDPVSWFPEFGLGRNSMSSVCSLRPVDQGKFTEPPAGPVSSLKVLWDSTQKFQWLSDWVMEESRKTACNPWGPWLAGKAGTE